MKGQQSEKGQDGDSPLGSEALSRRLQLRPTAEFINISIQGALGR